MSSNKSSDSDYGSLISSNNLSFSISSPTSCCSSSTHSSGNISSNIDLNDDNSSTASGPIYVRQPGFEFHAHEVTTSSTPIIPIIIGEQQQQQQQQHQKTVKNLTTGKTSKKNENKPANTTTTTTTTTTKLNNKAKKKLCMMLNSTDTLSPIIPIHSNNNNNNNKEYNNSIHLKPISNKAKREPLPMRLRALPPSFWQQPNQPNSSLNTMYLPPLFKNDIIESVIDDNNNTTTNTNAATTTINNNNDDYYSTNVNTNTTKNGMFDSIQNYREIKISPANTDLLFKLFDNIEQRDKKQLQQLQLQYNKSNITTNNNNSNRLNTKQPLKGLSKALIKGEDPCIVDAVTEGLFPLLRLDSSSPCLRNNETVHFFSNLAKQTNDCLLNNFVNSNGLSNSSPVLINTNNSNNTSNMIMNNQNILPSLQFEQNYSQALSEVVAAL